MLSWIAFVRSLGVALLVIAGIAMAVWVYTKEMADMLRRLAIRHAFAGFERWADRNRYKVLLREQVGESPFGKSARGPLVFRVVVQDESGQRQWGWVRCGITPEVKWAEPESVFAAGVSGAELPGVFDPELDHGSSPWLPSRRTRHGGTDPS